MCEMMLKGSKEALTVLIVTYVTQVKKIKSGVCGLCIQYRNIQCYVERGKTRDIYIFAHNFLNTQIVFNL